MPSLAALLRQRKLASPYSDQADHVFVGQDGRPPNHRTVSRAFESGAKAAGLNSDGIPKIRFHDLRHCFASMLIAQGSDVVFLSRQLGHASPDITLKVYSHLYDAKNHAARFAAALEDGFGSVLSQATGEVDAEDREVVELLSPKR